MNYDELFTNDGGVLFWKPRGREHFKSDRSHSTWNARYAGKEAGTVNTYKGYSARRVTIDGKNYMAHHIVFVMHYGWMPKQIDHIDGNSLNNDPANMRAAAGSQNHYNRRMRSDNRCGLKGVSWHKPKGKWYASIVVDGRSKWLGYHPTKGLAAVARAKAAIRYHGEYARL